MTEQKDCPICFETLDFGGKNCMRTECGHEFHSSCIMMNLRRSNDFNCPYCRQRMVEPALAPRAPAPVRHLLPHEAQLIRDILLDPHLNPPVQWDERVPAPAPVRARPPAPVRAPAPVPVRALPPPAAAPAPRFPPAPAPGPPDQPISGQVRRLPGATGPYRIGEIVDRYWYSKGWDPCIVKKHKEGGIWFSPLNCDRCGERGHEVKGCFKENDKSRQYDLKHPTLCKRCGCSRSCGGVLRRGQPVLVENCRSTNKRAQAYDRLHNRQINA